MVVLDLSCDVAGRFAAKLLAMSGMRVLRPANPATPADTALDLYLDAGKLTLPWPDSGKTDELLNQADVVFTTFDHGKFLGLAAGDLKFPKNCVQVTTSSFGSWGPYAALQGGPLADWAAGGYLAITGEPDREPLIGPEHLCGYAGGYYAAIAAEAALLERRQSGLGQHIDVSTMESMLSLHQTTFCRMAAGIVRPRTGRYTEVYPLTVLPCADGHVSLGIVTDAEFDRLALIIDRPDLVVDPRFDNLAARWANRDALDRELAGFLLAHSADDIVALLQEMGVAATKVATVADTLINPQLAHRNFLAPLAGPEGPLMPGSPIPAAKVFATAGAGLKQSKLQQSTNSTRSGECLPLTGIVVLDFTAFWAGPSAARNLADLGAEVIKVERPGSRVDLENNPDMLIEHLFHCKMNRHKQSIVLDLTDPAERETARKLALQADVLIENYRPGVAAKLGLGAEALCAANPGLVYISLSGFGASGPWGAWRSWGPNIEAVSSVESRTGYRDDAPLRLGHTLPDGVGGLAGTLAALRGLRERDMRGCGGWFDISQLESYMVMSGEDILAAAMSGTAFPRIGNRARDGAIQGVFPCRGDDQWIALRLANADDVDRFDTATGISRFREIAALSPRNDDLLESLIGSYTASREKSALADALQTIGLEAMPVLTPVDLLKDTHLRERQFFTNVDVNGRNCLLPGSPLHGSRRFADSKGLAPRFGEHKAAVLERLTRV